MPVMNRLIEPRMARRRGRGLIAWDQIKETLFPTHLLVVRLPRIYSCNAFSSREPVKWRWLLQQTRLLRFDLFDELSVDI
jgi:hypothetical protein